MRSVFLRIPRFPIRSHFVCNLRKFEKDEAKPEGGAAFSVTDKRRGLAGLQPNPAICSRQDRLEKDRFAQRFAGLWLLEGMIFPAADSSTRTAECGTVLCFRP